MMQSTLFIYGVNVGVKLGNGLENVVCNQDTS